MKIRLHDGSAIDFSAAPWKTTVDDEVLEWLVVLPNIGSTIMKSDELAERLVD